MFLIIIIAWDLPRVWDGLQPVLPAHIRGSTCLQAGHTSGQASPLEHDSSGIECSDIFVVVRSNSTQSLQPLKYTYVRNKQTIEINTLQKYPMTLTVPFYHLFTVYQSLMSISIVGHGTHRVIIQQYHVLQKGEFLILLVWL